MKEQKDISAEVQEELDEISPNLGKLSRQHPYEVPAEYFEALGKQAAQMAKDVGVQKTSLIRRLLTIRNVAAAASVVIIAILSWVFSFNIPNEDLAEASVDEMILYLEEESAFGIDEYELVKELIDIESVGNYEEIEEMTTDVVGIDEITDEDIIEYLLEEDIELGTIIEAIN